MGRRCAPFSPIGEEPLRQDPDFDRDFWRAHARRSMREAFDGLESGRRHFGDWERLFLSAAIDHFRDRHFEQASVSAQRIFHEHQRPPFTGQFTQEKSLADLRAEYEELAGEKPS
jgi:hypothetical protein